MCGWAGAWRGVASERTGWEWFCHSIHIITGVTLFYVGGGFITGVFVCFRRLHPSASALRPLISSRASPLPHREHIFRAPSLVISLGFHHIFNCSLVLPVSVPARTGTGRVGPPERLPSSCSPARVKGGNHVFGECRWRHDYSLRLRPLLPDSGAR